MVVPAVEMAQLDAQHSCLQGVESRVDSDLTMEVALVGAVLAQGAQTFGEVGVRGDDHSRIAERAQILGRVETEAARVPTEPAVRPTGSRAPTD